MTIDEMLHNATLDVGFRLLAHFQDDPEIDEADAEDLVRACLPAIKATLLLRACEIAKARLRAEL